MKAYRGDMSVYITTPNEHVEVFYLAFPRFIGKSCHYGTLDPDCRARVDEALSIAQEVAATFTADGRENESAATLRKAFARYAQYRSEHPVEEKEIADGETSRVPAGNRCDAVDPVRPLGSLEVTPGSAETQS